MNQAKIGVFIAQCRKEVGLTQSGLAEKLNITDRAVSKWERGKSLPDASIMLELCSILEITVNDLLSGERLGMENYNKELENKLLEMVKEKEQKDKQLLALEWVVGTLSVLILLVASIVASYVPNLQEWVRSLIVLAGLIPCVIGVCFAIKIEQTAGYYECRKCGHRYVPTLRAVIWAPHMGRTRKMRCPKCQEKSWQKKVISKEKE